MPFRAILTELVARPGSVLRGAIFCDDEGERIEAVLAPPVLTEPALDPYRLDLVGASYAIVLHLLGEDRDEAQLRIVHEREVVWVQGITGGYYLVALASRRGLDPCIGTPLRQAARALRAHL